MSLPKGPGKSWTCVARSQRAQRAGTAPPGVKTQRGEERRVEAVVRTGIVAAVLRSVQLRTEDPAVVRVVVPVRAGATPVDERVRAAASV